MMIDVEDVKRLVLGPSDVLVIRVSPDMTWEQMRDFTLQLRDRFGDQILVMAGAESMEVVEGLQS